MKLRVVTMTGADDGTDPQELRRISERFPFVEWGVLYSQSKSGGHPRYPNLAQVMRIDNAVRGISVHLCGSRARSVANGAAGPMMSMLEVARHARRVQINLGAGLAGYFDIVPTLRRILDRMIMQIIVQTYSHQAPVIAGTGNTEARSSIKGPGTRGVVFLEDASGGAGKAFAFSKPDHLDLVGFAGGINAENVEAKIQEIEALGIENPVWIDMETGVRTNDKFDLSKVEHILGTVERYVVPSERTPWPRR